MAKKKSTAKKTAGRTKAACNCETGRLGKSTRKCVPERLAQECPGATVPPPQPKKTSRRTAVCYDREDLDRVLGRGYLFDRGDRQGYEYLEENLRIRTQKKYRNAGEAMWDLVFIKGPPGSNRACVSPDLEPAKRDIVVETLKFLDLEPQAN